MTWHQIMRPRQSMLKFRLPWEPGRTPYLKGEILLPVWGPVTTTESRLLVAGDAPIVDYDHREYEERMFAFNTLTRASLYPHDVREGEGIDHCYDCKAEVTILGDYLAKWERVRQDDLPRRVAQLSRRISKSLSSSRTLADPNSDPDERTLGIRQRQWVGGKPPYLLGKSPGTDGDFLLGVSPPVKASPHKVHGGQRRVQSGRRGTAGGQPPPQQQQQQQQGPQGNGGGGKPPSGRGWGSGLREGEKAKEAPGQHPGRPPPAHVSARFHVGSAPR
jgi:hypothetical protein